MTVLRPSVFHQKYRWDEQLGQGGFASVRIGQDKKTGESYAVKVLDLKVGTVSANISARILGRAKDEAAVWTMVGQHNNIVKIHEAFIEPKPGTSAGLYMMVMELCQCTLLERLEETRSLPSPGMAKRFREILLGLQHMHSQSICHRDIKPANILFGGPQGDTVKLCDFGFSCVIPEQGISLKACGSPSYMSPEVAANQVFYHNADVWSAGVTCYVVLYGALPYTNPSGDVREVIIKGLPTPAYLAAEGVEPQEPASIAASFVEMMLKRESSERCSSESALRHKFVLQPLCHPAINKRLDDEASSCCEQLSELSTADGDSASEAEMPSSSDVVGSEALSC